VRDERFGWVVTCPDNDLWAIDRRLADLARFRLPDDALGTHGIRPDLQIAAVSAKSRVVAIDRAGVVVWELPHPAWGRGDSERGSCWFSDDGLYVWAHVPTAHGPDEWLLLRTETGAVAGRSNLSCYSAGSRSIRHPDGVHVGLLVGEGQDGSNNYLGRVEGGTPTVDRLDDPSRVLVSFSPDGRYFMTTPHADGPIQIHRFSDRVVVGNLEPGAVFSGDEGFDFYGGFIDDEVVVLTARELDAILVATVPGFDEVHTVGLPIRRAGEFVDVFPGGLLTSDWNTGQTMTWRLVR
jgi:hypothetical protein